MVKDDEIPEWKIKFNETMLEENNRETMSSTNSEIQSKMQSQSAQHTL